MNVLKWKFHYLDAQGYWRAAEKVDENYPKHPMLDSYVLEADHLAAVAQARHEGRMEGAQAALSKFSPIILGLARPELLRKEAEGIVARMELEKETDSLDALASTPPEPSGWRTIDSAPSGQTVLVCDGERVWADYKAAADNKWILRQGDESPTHWMPLPEGPKRSNI